MPSTEKKFKKFDIMTYAVTEEINEILTAKFKEGSIDAYAYILHDMDCHEDGRKKEPHSHIVLLTTTHRTATSVQNWFRHCHDFKGEFCNTFVETTKEYYDGSIHEVDLKGATYYLVHENKNGEPLGLEKWHYDWDEVTSKNLELLKNPPQLHIGRKPKEDRTFEILEDILAGKNLREMGRKYGRDFILHYRQYFDLAQAIKLQEDEICEIQEEAYTDAWLEARGEATQDKLKASVDNVKLTRENQTMKAKLHALGEEF